MNRRHDDRGEVRLDGNASVLADPELTAEQRLGSGGAEADEYLRLQQRELGVQPRPAGGDLGGVRLLVDPSLARGCHLKCLTALVT